MRRSQHLRVLLALATALALLAAIAVRPAGAGAVQEVDSVTITVREMDRALAFYEDVLGFEKVSDVEVAGAAYDQLLASSGLRLRIARMRLGDEFIELMRVIAPEGRPIPADSRSNDLWFQHIAIITPDMARAYAWLRDHEVRHSSPAPQRLPDWNPNAGGIEAFYFKDPDGNNLEVLAFPDGKGDPKWHEPSERLFVGIDHTAIAVADTNESLAFWRGALGLKVVGESENYGPEQERLNNVPGAHLRITALRAPAGPGVELLEYLAPEGGRPFPADTEVSDLWHWQINVTSPDVGAATANCVEPCVPVSPGVIELTDEIAVRSSALIRDPDGHAVLLADR
jgi:catechol 2,3-dioxygenase-like lactoylglutathione lyase family enzyme